VGLGSCSDQATALRPAVYGNQLLRPSTGLLIHTVHESRTMTHGVHAEESSHAQVSVTGGRRQAAGRTNPQHWRNQLLRQEEAVDGTRSGRNNSEDPRGSVARHNAAIFLILALALALALCPCPCAHMTYETPHATRHTPLIHTTRHTPLTHSLTHTTRHTPRATHSLIPHTTHHTPHTTRLTPLASLAPRSTHPHPNLLLIISPSQSNPSYRPSPVVAHVPCTCHGRFVT
jgi:hypothetical protein